jgi:hypothetical protein
VAKTISALPEALVVLVEATLALIVLVVLLLGVAIVDRRLVVESVLLTVVVMRLLISPALLLALELFVKPLILVKATPVATFFVERLIVSLLIFLAVSSLERWLRVLLLVLTTRAETVLILMAILRLVGLFGIGLLLAICFLHHLIVFIVLPLLVSVSHRGLLLVLVEHLPAIVLVFCVVLVVIVVASPLVMMVLITSLIMLAITVIPIRIILVILRVASISILLIVPVGIVTTISVVVSATRVCRVAAPEMRGLAPRVLVPSPIWREISIHVAALIILRSLFLHLHIVTLILVRALVLLVVLVTATLLVVLFVRMRVLVIIVTLHFV